MTDGVDVVETQRNKADLNSVLSAWVTDNPNKDIDEMSALLRGRNKTLIAIAYTETA